MTKSIHTLIPDIYETISNKQEGWFTEAIAGELGHEIAQRLRLALGEQRGRPTLRLSQMGPRCPKALWHSIRTPELAEKIQPWVEIKFSYGHILEALVIALAKASGHEVTGEQDEVSVDGVLGHRDCVIDGCIVDVKSSVSHLFGKFERGDAEEIDSFGYLSQLDGYLVGSLQDPLVRVKDKAYLLIVDKQLGHLGLYEHTIRESYIRKQIEFSKSIVALAEPPKCQCGTLPDGESGNIKLNPPASYSAYKWLCFPQLRCFLYSGGPRYLTKVVKRPFNKNGPIPEIDRYGKYVYN